MIRRKYLKVALTPDQYADLSIRADRAGLTLADYVRTNLADTRQVIEVEEVLARIETKLAAPVVNPTTVTPGVLEPLLVENLLLVRELVAERNAQVLTRVAQQLNSRYPGRTRV